MLSASVPFNWSSCFFSCAPPYSVLNTAASMILFNLSQIMLLHLMQGKSQGPPSGLKDTPPLPPITSLVSSSPALLTSLWTHWPPCWPQICIGCLPLRPHPCISLSLTSHLFKVCSNVIHPLFKVATCPQTLPLALLSL